MVILQKYLKKTSKIFDLKIIDTYHGILYSFFALILFMHRLKKNDEVIMSAQTHVATAHAVEICGAKPVFVDCELDTGNIKIDEIERKISSKTVCICVTHFLGKPTDMNKINKIAKKYKLKVVEDTAYQLILK